MTLKRRAHVVLPGELVDEIDRLVGRRRRSEFIAEALEEVVRRQRLLAAFEAVAGSIKEGDVPEWDTPESAYAWVRSLRTSGTDPWAEPSEAHQ